MMESEQESKHKLAINVITPNLCFNKEIFRKDDFNVDQFVATCRRHTSLESLREDLKIYMKTLQSAMIELINKDYADFVNLSSNLVGFDKAIANLTTPLGQLSEEVLSVRSLIDETITVVESKIEEQNAVQRNKEELSMLISIYQSIDKVEKLLGIQNTQTAEAYNVDLSGPLLERVAAEFCQLQFYVNSTTNERYLDSVKPRIAYITSMLQQSLERSLLQALKSNDGVILQRCLRTYVIIDKIKDAEYLYRMQVVKPYMEQIICEETLQAQPDGLQHIYTQVLQFIPTHYRHIHSVLCGELDRKGDVIQGYDFPVNSIWPEIVANIEARIPSIFAPGNPNIFHQKYKVSLQFLDRFERQCGSHASIKRLRNHTSYNVFLLKWSLPVYFQIRFQEIAGELEMQFFEPFTRSTAGDGFLLLCTSTLWKCLHRCWHEDIMLPSLTHRFWKLTLQLIARYTTWLRELPKQQRKEGSDDEAKGEIDISQYVCVIADCKKLLSKVSDFFSSTVVPHLHDAGVKDMVPYTNAMKESEDLIVAELPSLSDIIVTDITERCMSHLKAIADTPRLYRRTNKPVPYKESTYVGNLLNPIETFIEQHSDTIDSDTRTEWVLSILNTTTDQYMITTSEVLNSVRKMEESLKRLKKARGSNPQLATAGMTDDDKIRLQLYLDVTEYESRTRKLEPKFAEQENLKSLKKLVEDEKNNANTT